MIHLKKICKKNKKGFLLAEQTVKLVIALIAIGFLVFLLVSLYYGRATAEKKKQAIETLTGDNMIEGHLRNIRVDGDIANVSILTPRGWDFFSFTGNNPKPNDCRGQNCLCICDSVWAVSWNSLWTSERERQINECEKNGACLVIPKLESEEIEGIRIDGQIRIFIKQEGGEIKISKE